MKNIPELRTISTPEELKSLLKEIKRAVASGDLVQVRTNSQFETKVEVGAVPDDGPWPDYIELHFKGTAFGQGYRLCVETYHGNGGEWEMER